MENKDVEVMSVDSWDEKEIMDLYKSAGWWEEYDEISEIKTIIKNSCVFVVAYDKNLKKAVGMARLLSDGVSDAYIQDVYVIEDYRKIGLGTKLIIFLIKFCKKKGISWIGLIAKPNQNNFYSKFGFKKMKNYIPMKYSFEG